MKSTNEGMDLTRAAQRFHALSDATRLQLVLALVGGERCVCELMEQMGAAQSRLSFHLRVLKEAGLVRDRRKGRWVYYALEADALEGMADLLSAAREGRWRPRPVPERRALPVAAANGVDVGCCETNRRN